MRYSRELKKQQLRKILLTMLDTDSADAAENVGKLLVTVCDLVCEYLEQQP